MIPITKNYFAILVLGLAFVTDISAGTVYKVVGPDGKVSYTDVKPITIHQEVRNYTPEPNSSGNIKYPAPIPKQIELFTITNCSPCSRVKAAFKDKGIPYTEINTDFDIPGRYRLNELGGRGVPFMLVDKDKKYTNYKDILFMIDRWGK